MKMCKKLAALFLVPAAVLAIYLQSCDGGSSGNSAPVTFAVIGDFGVAGSKEAKVAEMVKGWKPEYIVTVGDNNYQKGAASTIDANIGQYYHQFIYPYNGSYGAGATTNRFFPSLGNHDWQAPNAQPYLDYFSLPGNERYYDIVINEVHLFIVDSDEQEPDGITKTSAQAMWLKDKLAESNSTWKIVIMHHAPYSSSANHGSTPELQWPYKEWGADVVLAGHDHSYERLAVDGLTYIVNGLGGNPNIYEFATPLPGSLVRFNEDHGALAATVSPSQLQFRFHRLNGDLVDSVTLSK